MPKFLHSQTNFTSGRIGKTYKGKWDLKNYASGCLELENLLVTGSSNITKIAGETIIDDIANTLNPLLNIKAVQSFSAVIHGESYSMVFITFENFGNNDVQVLVYKDGAFQTTSQLNVNIVGTNFDMSFATVNEKVFIAFKAGTLSPMWIEFSFPLMILTLTIRKLEDNVGFFTYPFTDANIDSNVNITIANATNGVVGVQLTYSAGIGRDPIDGEIVVIGGFWDNGGSSEFGKNFFIIDSHVGLVAQATPYIYDTSNNTYPLDGTYTEVYFQAWGVNGEFPKVASSSDGRLILANTESKPATFWGSAVGNETLFSNLKPTLVSLVSSANASFFGDLVNTDPYAFTISSPEGADIEWIRANKELAIGASSNMFLARAFEGILGPLNIDIKPFSAFGTSGEAVATSDVIYFTSNNDNSLIRFNYNSQNQSYNSNDVSILSPDLFGDSIKKLVSDKVNKCILILKNNGDINLIVDEPSANVLAFCVRLPVDGAKVETLTYSEREGLLYGVVYINGLYYTFTLDLSKSTENIDYMRFKSSYDAVPTLTVIPTEFSTDFDGETIYYYIDGAPETILTSTLNAAGEFSVPGEAGAVTYIYGLQNNCRYQSMPIEAGNQWGSPDMSIKRLDSVQVRLLDSISYKVRIINTENTHAYEEEQVTDTYSLGDARIRTSLGTFSEEDQILEIVNEKIEPLTISAITFRGVANDG